MAGALAAASTVDSGSDTAGGTYRSGDEVLRSSVHSLSGRDFSTVRSSRSISLAYREEGQPFAGGLLRLSSPGPHSPGEVSRSSLSVGSVGSNLRRSLEQFAAEDDLSSMNMLDDAPMLASVNNSADFRRQAAAARFSPPASAFTAPAHAAKPVAGAEDRSRVGIAHAAARNPHPGVVAAPAPALLSTAALQSDSLVYSPSVSVATAGRSRYSAEEPETSDLDDSFVERRPQPKEAAPAKPAKSRWSKAADRTEDDVSFNVTDSSAGDWTPAAAAAAPDGDRDARADAKTRRGADGSPDKVTDSVDSFKREFRAAQERNTGAKGEGSVADSADRFRNTGDHTAMSSIPTLEDSVNTFSDQEHDFLRDRGGHGLGSTTTTNVEDMLSSTIDSEGDIAAAPAGGRSGAGRGHEGGRRADHHDRDAARGGNSKSNVEHFGADDEGSINSLALSDSNNLDEL
jgi:hypothetical protein